MATRTTYLKMQKPNKGEFRNSWHIPANGNYDLIDSFAQSVGDELTTARFSYDSLGDFLSVSLNSDGSLKATAEVLSARNSPVYGFQEGPADQYDLGQRVDQGDWEIWNSREGHDSLRDGLAQRVIDFPNQILSGSSDSNGFPAWMGFSADEVNVNGSVDPLVMFIDGYLSKVRTLKSVTLSGASGTKYIYAMRTALGVATVDGDSGTPPPAGAEGTTYTDSSSNAVLFQDATKDFTTLDVKPGDILELLDGNDAGRYVIEEVAPDLGSGAVSNTLKIKSKFPVGGLSSINYLIYDPLAVTLGFDTAETPAADKAYIGEADFDGSAVTAVRPRNFKSSWASEWRAIDVSGTPTFEEIFSHNFGSDELEISIQVSQADDGSLPVEELSLAGLSNTLDVDITNTLSVDLTNTLDVDITNTLGVTDEISGWNDGGSGATLSYGPGSLTGDVTGSLTGALSAALNGSVTASLTGDVKPTRSVAAKWDKNRLWVKNVVSGSFYTDYDGSSHQVGYIRVIVRKRG